MEKFFTYSHIFCGVLVLLLGLVNFVSKKGTRRHVAIGRIYVGAMWWICLSALGIIVFYRFSMFLMVIAVITFYTSFVGLRVLRRRKLGSEKWYDWTASVLTAAFGVGLLMYAATLFLSGKNEILGMLSVVFGGLALNMGIQDIRFFSKANTDEKKWWLYQHIGAISGSYIAAVTAFAVQNGEALGITNHNWLLWVLPGVIGSVLISITIKKQKMKNGVVLRGE